MIDPAVTGRLLDAISDFAAAAGRWAHEIAYMASSLADWAEQLAIQTAIDDLGIPESDIKRIDWERHEVVMKNWRRVPLP